VYFPNAGRKLNRLEHKTWFDKEFLNYCNKLHQKKPLIIGGDFNVAHKELDIAKPKEDFNNPGFTMEEREWFTHFLNQNYVDTFRTLHPEEEKYTFWSYQFNALEKNIGWRLDYLIISSEIKKNLQESSMINNLSDNLGSDHCPITLTMKF
jgi:exodeoxyribonuclease-3